MNRWYNGMARMHAAGASAGLTLAQHKRLSFIMQMTPPFGFFGLAYLCEIEKARRDMPFLHITDTTDTLGPIRAREIRENFARNRHLAEDV